MSLKKIDEVKKDKGFRIFDLIIYGVVAALAAALFIVVFTTKSADPLSGVRIYVAATPVFEYEFGGEAEILSPETVTVDKEDSSGITVTVKNGEDYNVIYINKAAKSVEVRDANCNGKECTYMKMNDDGDFIFCSPHGLKIEPYEVDLDNPNIKI